MLRAYSDRIKKYRKKAREDWMWYEDPYRADTGKGRHKDTTYNHGGAIPAPNPLFGAEPPVHSFA